MKFLGGKTMPKIVNKAEKKEKLVQAAIPIFAKHGYRDTKMSDIAIAAEVGKGTLYEYFDSKDALFLGAFELWFSTFVDQLEYTSSKDDNAYDTLINFFDQYFQTIEEYVDIYYIYFDFWSEMTRNPNLNKNSISKEYQCLRDLIMNILEQGTKQQIFQEMEHLSVSISLLAVAEGILVQWLFDQSVFLIRKVGLNSIKRILDTYKNG